MMSKNYFTVSLLLVALVFLPAVAQEKILQPVGLGEYMGEFTLESFQGDEFSMSDFSGKKNVLMIFPRGKVLDNLWCPICYYQYAEIAEWAKKTNAETKYDLQILYVLPYSKDSINDWSLAAQNGFKAIDRWKNPMGYDTLTGPRKEWAEYVREFFPQEFNYLNGEIPLTIPILVDADKHLSKTLALHTKEWGGTKTDQNKPTIYLMDKEGKIQFKYHSQYTNDRATANYLERIIQTFL